MTTQKSTRLVARIPVIRADGTRDTVEDWGDFQRVRFLEGNWSDWGRSGGRYLLHGQHVNPTDDERRLQVAATGEMLTVATPDQ